MRKLKCAAVALGGLLAAALVSGASAAPLVNPASPALQHSQNAAVETVYYRRVHPYYHRGFYWNHHWWHHRYWRGHRWYYY